jgi:nickel transport protein
MSPLRFFFRLGLPLVAGLFPLFSGQSSAHSVHIFAWADGERICSESYFSKSNRVRDGEALMADAQGRILAQSRTDEQGLACFPLPDKARDLTFTILAGPGHKGEFLLRAADLAASFPPSAPSPDSPSPAAAPETALTRSPSSSREDEEARLRLLVSRELQRQLAPVLQTLAEIKESKDPGLSEILGGIGWILGVAALAQWIALRRKRPAEDPGQGKE